MPAISLLLRGAQAGRRFLLRHPKAALICFEAEQILLKHGAMRPFFGGHQIDGVERSNSASVDFSGVDRHRRPMGILRTPYHPGTVGLAPPATGVVIYHTYASASHGLFVNPRENLG